jgi:hypothetical protein
VKNEIRGLRFAHAMNNNNFDFLLLAASKALGSLLDVATLLGVEPRQVYWWLACVERPSDAREQELVYRLRSVLDAPR